MAKKYTANLDSEKIKIDNTTTLTPFLGSDERRLYKVDKLFFSAVKEEEWLNMLASKGYILVERKISGYVFTADGYAKDYYFSVCSLDTPATSEASSAVIESRRKLGSDVFYTYGNKAYFKTPFKVGSFNAALSDAASKRRHLRGVFAFNLSMLCFWLGLLCYNLSYWVRFDSAGVLVTEKSHVLWDYTIDMSALFGDYPTTPYISLFLVLTVLFIPSTVYFLDQYLYSRYFEKEVAKKCVEK